MKESDQEEMKNRMEALQDQMCVMHMSDSDDECALCINELEELNKVYQAQIFDNGQLEQRLQGLGQQVDMGQVLSLRLNVLIDMICNGNPKQKMKFELTYAGACFQALQEAEVYARRQKLLGTNGHPVQNMKGH